MRKYLLLITSFIIVQWVCAQTMTVNAPSRVQVGENFRLSYVVNTQNTSDFKMGDVPEGLEIITGPYRSEQMSFQMTNGHTSSSSSVTYTFIICAEENGSYTIPAAHVQVNGKTVSSHPVKITVSGHSSNNNGAPKMHDDSDQHQVRPAGSAINGSDLFIKVSANKRRVHEQEPILLTYKVYTLVDLISLEGKMPDLTGVHSQEITHAQQPSYHVEQLNGRNYRCVTWSQYIMYPQITGKLEIPSITFNGTVVQQNRDVDPFEAFFNGGSGYVEVKRSIKAPGLTIQVDPLPTKPANFSGGVGKFNISAQLNKTSVKANDPITVRVVVSGNGNLKLIKQPVVNFPKDFDKYDAKVTDKTKLTANGVEGNMIYDFLAVPRNQGEYTIPPVEFVYYDTNANAYKTIKTESFKLEVEQGSGSASSVNYAEEKTMDIRPIKTGKVTKSTNRDLFYGSTLYWALLVILLVSFLALLFIFRHRAIENADVVKMRGKKANKVATKRLRTARKLMDQNRQGEFYDEVLRALWGYVGDKLNIPVTELSHDNIAEKLTGQNVNGDTVSKFIEALDECEFERYAPGDPAGNMNKTFATAIEAIEKIEEDMKKGKRAGKSRSHTSATMLLMAVISVISLIPLSAHAITKQNADAEFSKGNYQQAVKDYEEILKSGESSVIYFNLGNAYYRMDNITMAVLNYERALLLDPANEDARFNLKLANSKTIDKITPKSEMFFFSWFRAVVNFLNADGWAVLAIISIVLALLLTLLYLFSSPVILRKIGFYGGALFFIVFLLSNFFAYQQKKAIEQRTGAIVVAPSATMKNTPSSSGTDVGVIHEGTRVDVIDDTMLQWKAVRLADGREGWILKTQIEKI